MPPSTPSPPTPFDVWAESRLTRDVRSLPRTLWDATRLVWRAGRSELLVVSALQIVTALLLAAQVIVGRAALQGVLDADRGSSLRSAAVPLVALAAAAAAASLTAPLLLQEQRLLGELVQRATYDQVLDVTESVDLVAFESSVFFDRLQRVQAHAVPQPALVTQGLVQLLGGVTGVIALVVALVAIEPLLVPLLVAAGLPLVWVSRRGSATEFAFAVAQTPAQRLRHYLRTLLTARDEAKEVRSFGAQSYLRSRYDGSWDGYLQALRRHIRHRARLALVSSVVATVATAGTLLVLLLLVVRDRITLAEAGAAAIAVRLLSGRLEQLAGASGRLFESALFLDDLRAFLALQQVPAPAGNGAEPPRSVTSVEAQGLGFRYPSGSEHALDGVDLELRRGEVVALVGANGSGKTTLVKVLAGLFVPSNGVLTWDGVNTLDLDPVALRRRVAVVFQDFVRYALPARDNVALGHRDELDAVSASAVAAGADAFLAPLPQSYETVLSAEFAGGTDLSGGEWQRVAIARALHRDAALVLLDEPSAALDPLAEQQLLATVRSELADRIVVLVSHRLSTIRMADRILLMHEGRIVERGTHDELIRRGGRYAQMYAQQTPP
ncbi:MAG: ABC transporter ATP-binding protein/permease [Actinobacteria bacterium]|nr:ABC transporter ATP-binding protein/permease [Actinomycetota bacterium]MCA1720268.1 ABC transporter ATP-binding protein/permease [Actinomycetota bacterium]